MRVGDTKQRLQERGQQIEDLGAEVESLAERHFFRRLDRLAPVGRFVISWLLFFVLLCGCLVGQIRALDGHFRSLQPVPGGIYTEGILGDFTNANPLYASTEVDESVSRLVFAGLLTYNSHNQLIGDLADDWSLDNSEKVYTVKLRPGLTWQDGKPLTSADVLFTYKMIQNPDAGSVLQPSWKGVTVAAPDPLTVTFTLPNSLAAFPNKLTNGIIPEHLLKDVAPAELRASLFNTAAPVGAGPFKWEKVEVSGATPELRQAQIALLPFEQYHAGAPKLSTFIVRAFHDPDTLAESFVKKELTAASFTELPAKSRTDANVQTNNFLLTAENMVFFREGLPLFADAAVRKALVQSANTAEIIGALNYPTHAVTEPILEGQLGFDKAYKQLPYDPAAATAALDSDGWKPGPDGIRLKNGDPKKPLEFTLDAQDSPETRMVTGKLREQWRAVGAAVHVALHDSEDLQPIIANHSYDALLYGTSIGADPDVFVYWDSSQVDPRSNHLNFSEYKSKAADGALEGARTRIDPALRAVKYKPFLQAWQQDAPALGLYQPRYMYATHGTVFGLHPRAINNDTDRFNNVQNWEIRQALVTNP